MIDLLKEDFGCKKIIFLFRKSKKKKTLVCRDVFFFFSKYAIPFDIEYPECQDYQIFL